jgi:hypothetical protein
MAYFSKFPVLQYPVGTDLQNFRLVWVRNLLRRIALSDEIKSGVGAFYTYDVKDGERPEHIAERLYGSPDYHWLVLLCNNIINPYHDWCKSESALQEYISKKYSGYAVFITKPDDTFFFDPAVVSGCTLSQGKFTASITNFEPTLCRVVVADPSFAAGSATIDTGTGTLTPVEIHRVLDYQYSVHHFEVQKGTSDIGAADKFIADPLSYQSSTYGSISGSIGVTLDEYPESTEGLNYAPNGATYGMWQTFIGGYMGISGSAYNSYAVSNIIYEMGVNDDKRKIRVLDPAYKKQATRELEALLGV